MRASLLAVTQGFTFIMRRLLATVLLLFAIIGVAGASICARDDGAGACCVETTASLLCVTPAASATAGAEACCAPVVAAQSSIAPARSDKNELSGDSGHQPVFSGASHSVVQAQCLALQPERVFTATRFETGQTLYLLTGRLRR